MSRRLLVLLAVAVALTLLLSWPVWRSPSSAVAGDIGDPLLNTWILAWDVHALLTGVSVWDANSYYPARGTLAYTEHLLSVAVTSLPLEVVGSPLLAYNLAVLTSYALAFLGSYLLALQLWRRRWAALVAAVVFAFGPYRYAQLAHLQLLVSQWLPFSIILLERCWRAPAWRRLLALFTFLLLQLSVGWYSAVFALGTIAAWTATSLAVGRWHWQRRQIVLAPIAVGTLAVLFVLALPYTRSLTALRQQRPLSEAVRFSARPRDLLTAAPYNWLWGRPSARLRERPDFNGEHALYLGWVAPMAALLGTIRGLRDRCKRKVALVLLSTLLLSLIMAAGPQASVGNRHVLLPWGWLVSVLPPLQALRAPARWFMPASLGLGLLAARATAGRASSVALAALCLLEGASMPLPVAAVGSLAEQPAVYHLLAENRPRRKVLRFLTAGFPRGDSEKPGAVVELPLWVVPQPEYPEARRLYRSTLHWRPLVNGYSGLTPERQITLERELRAFPDVGSLATLREMAREGVAYLVVHPGEGLLDAGAWETDGRWRVAREPMLRLEAVSSGAWLYHLFPDGEREVLPLLAQFDNGIELVGYRWDEAGPLGPTLTLFWQGLSQPDRDWAVFVHMVEGGGAIVAQADGDPVSGHWPTGAWRAGEMVRDEHVFAQIGAGGSAFRVGWYDRASGERAAVLSGGDGIVLPLPAPEGQR